MAVKRIVAVQQVNRFGDGIHNPDSAGVSMGPRIGRRHALCGFAAATTSTAAVVTAAITWAPGATQRLVRQERYNVERLRS